MDRIGEVVVAESCLVTPSTETPRRALWLSPLDLFYANRGHIPLVSFYRPSCSGATDFFDVTRLKTALSKALVPFYPLAGRLDVGQDSRLQINCDGQGALFLVAHTSSLTVEDLSDFKPSPELRRLLVPHLNSAEAAPIICAIQVTFFRCGGVAIGAALHHLAVDGNAASYFFRAWTAFCKDGERAVVDLPCHDRALLSAREPPVVRPDALSILCPSLNLSEASGPVATEVFLLGKDHVSALKRICGGATTFCAVSAHMWRCMCLARRLLPGSTTRLVFPANVRRSLNPPLLDRYFGNAVIILATAGKTQDIIAPGGLASVAGRIRGLIGRMDDEVVRSAVDQLELAKIDGRPARGSLPATDLRVISWLGMPLYDMDFRWGKPVAALRVESNYGGFVHLMDASPQDGGGVRVIVCAEAAILSDFKRLLYANLQHSVL
ncbi:putrescine hydroxycinnamoyltransferase 1 [Lolium perenne]|uniref:putrescine hydroxycinnamoyltransferase 1 n=1 Tax=Lolium perenne TaxID=4522 RepID=UPI0021F6137C|nr:putrescine hydroxycinnamoyltransferase 1-like [Lolium perenne]